MAMRHPATHGRTSTVPAPSKSRARLRGNRQGEARLPWTAGPPHSPGVPYPAQASANFARPGRIVPHPGYLNSQSVPVAPGHPRTPGCAVGAARPKMPATAPTRRPVARPAGIAKNGWMRMALDSTLATAYVTTPSGAVTAIPAGGRLVFGRGPDADLVIAAGRGLSRQAGTISAVDGGAWIANISHTHALYAEGDGYRIRLPRMDESGEPAQGWFLREGSVLVGSRAMLDEGQPLRLVVTSAASPAGAVPDPPRADGDATLLPLYLDPNTKLFLVALMWCRPWLVEQARGTPLPRTPEIARAALQVTEAHHELDSFDN